MSVDEQVRRIRVVAAEIERDGRYLITQRRPQATMPLLWEFPGGKVEAGESDEDALRRELVEVLGLAVNVGELSLHVVHEYDTYTVDMLVYRATALGEPKRVYVNDFKWVTPETFCDYEFPDADQRTVDQLIGPGACR